MEKTTDRSFIHKLSTNIVMLSKQISKERSMKAENQLNFDHNLKLTKCGGIALLIMPLCYVCMFVIYSVILAIPQTDILSDKIAYMISNQGIISMANICGYLIFGGLLLIAVQAIHNRLAINKSHLLNSASAFGFIWVILMMCSGITRWGTSPLWTRSAMWDRLPHK